MAGRALHTTDPRFTIEARFDVFQLWSRSLNRCKRFPVLDGWRGISILLVLAGHMLPLGPKVLQLNAAVAATGMSLFFILSGFLIVSMLVKNDNVVCFLIRRVCRILPLAWSFLILVLLLNHANGAAWEANLFFYANLPPFYLSYTNGHFWSLCVEMQFYAAIATFVALAGRRGLLLVPIACLLVTAARIAFGVEISIVTWWRIDEILAGGCLALAFTSGPVTNAVKSLPYFTPFLVAPLLLASCHPAFGALNYARPYLAALLIGSTFFRPSDRLQRLLCGRRLGYVAEISYALYVIHPLTFSGWLGQGDVIVRYTKRAGSFVFSFFFAHLSTRYYEKYWIALSHRIVARIEAYSVPRLVEMPATGSL
jgi:peptidoglycan/LPS O-acetylase OafA/YrhL